MKSAKTNQGGLLLASLMLAATTISAQGNKNITKADALAAMNKASEYMVNTVSYNGGYLWNYAADFSERDGEAPARPSQIMVQGGTVDVGNLFLDVYEATGDEAYLKYAEKAADALIYGQHPLGGWHYFIDFDIQGLEDWYKQVASRFPVGMEEYRHYYGNCTFDDNTTQGATAYLLRVYMKTLSPEYLAPLKKALNFMLISQYPNGGWPQRYPLRYEFVHDGLPDYTSMYTLNDNAMSNTIDVLIDAYRQLGDERYLEAARRGGDFFMIAQGPSDQAGWAEQYDMQLQPCWARTHEPPGFMPRQTLVTIHTLEKLFLFTGDRRYLRPIPPALDWLDEAGLRVLDDGWVEYARYYEPGSNLPVQCDVLDKKNKEGYVLYNFHPVDKKTYLEMRARMAGSANPVIIQAEGGAIRYNLKEVRAVFERVKNVPEEDRQKLYEELSHPEHRPYRRRANQDIGTIIGSMNDKGAWIEDIEIWDSRPGQMIEGRKTVRGMHVGTYIRNMRVLMKFLSGSDLNF